MKATNIKNGKRVEVLHGENRFVPVDVFPEGEVVECKVYIAGHSETGHHHVLEAKRPFKVFESGSSRAVLLNEVTKLFHKKTFDIHKTQYLAPGAYKIYKKTEVDPFSGVVRAVFD
jgi:hypothetical protein